MRWLFASILTLSFLTAAGHAQRVPEQTVPEPQTTYNPHGALTDIMRLWPRDAPWPKARKKVGTIALVHYWIRRTPIEQVREIVEFAKRNRIKINLSVEAVRRYPNDCGIGEGYTFEGELREAARILKNLDADVEHVEIDEALWFGAYSTDPEKCHLTVRETIRRAALNMAEVLEFYPNVVISVIEPIPAITQIPTWRRDLSDVIAGLSRALGRQVRFVQLDIGWTDPAWPAALRDMRVFLRQKNVGMGIIYNGSPLADSDKAWIDSAIANIETVEGAMGIVPDLVAFETWDPYPRCNLPETAPTAMTWLINRYVRPRTRLEVQFRGQGVRGRLVTTDGKPVSNATIRGFQPGVDLNRPLPVQVLTGTVPPTAASLILGVRLNAECGGCDGQNDVLIGTLRYQEVQGGNARIIGNLPNTPSTANGTIVAPEIVGGLTVTRVVAGPGRPYLWNSDAVPVSANAKYVFTLPAGTVGGEGWFGNADMIWFDKDGNELPRRIVVPDRGKAMMSVAATGADGRFALPVMPRTINPKYPVTVEFDGANGAYRSTVWTPFY